MNLDIVRPEQVYKLFIITNIIQIYIMDNLFLVVYDYPWSIDGTDVWLTKPYKLASSLKDAKKDARFYKRVHPSYDVRVLPVTDTGRFGDPVFKL